MNFQLISSRPYKSLFFRAFVSFIFCLMLLSLSGLSFAEIYKWKNDDGSTGFTDDLSKVPPKYRDQVETREYRSAIPPNIDSDKETAQSDKVIPQTKTINNDYRRPEKKLSRREKKELDKELQGIWNNMKDALSGKKRTKKK